MSLAKRWVKCNVKDFKVLFNHPANELYKYIWIGINEDNEVVSTQRREEDKKK